MSGLIQNLLAAAEAELDRQIEAGKPGPYLEADYPDDWVIDGHVDMRAVVKAVAGRLLETLREPSAAMQEAAMHRIGWLAIRDAIGVFEREHGLGTPASLVGPALRFPWCPVCCLIRCEPCDRAGCQHGLEARQGLKEGRSDDLPGGHTS
jgi:hypothetical protein